MIGKTRAILIVFLGSEEKVERRKGGGGGGETKEQRRESLDGSTDAFPRFFVETCARRGRRKG